MPITLRYGGERRNMSQGPNSEPTHVFRASGIIVGGIYPFPLGAGFLWPPHGFKEASESQIRAYQNVRSPDLPDSNPTALYELQAVLETVRVKDLHFEKLPIQFLLCVYKEITGINERLYPGIATLAFRIKLHSKDILTASEIIQLARMLTGYAAPNVSDEIRIEVAWANGTIFRSLLGVCQDLQTRCFGSDGKPPNFPEFVHPILFLGDIPLNASGSEIARKFEAEIAAIANLSELHLSLSKERERKTVMESEVHPFEYGLTYVARRMTLEIHTVEGLKRSAEILRQTDLAAHVDDEWTDLAAIAEHAVAYYFFLRLAHLRLDAVGHTKPAPPRNISESESDLIPFIGGFLRLTRLREEIGSSLAKFRTPSLKRRAWIQRTLGLYQKALGSEELEKSVEEKLKLLTQAIETRARWMQWGFALIVSLAALTFTIAKFFTSKPQ